MLPFVIERLIISGLGKTDSVIEFSDGLTFVVGPSGGVRRIYSCSCFWQMPP